MGGNTGSGDSNDKARKDTEVTAYEREIQKQKAKAKALADAAKGTLSDPREKDDTAARADLQKGNQVKSTGGDGGGQQQQQQETKKIIVEDKAKSEAETQAAAEQADAYKKRRLALTGGRSLFARRGGRGFFN